MSRFIGNCVVMGVKARPSQDGKRIFRTAVLYFEEDTSTLEASVSERRCHVALIPVQMPAAIDRKRLVLIQRLNCQWFDVLA